MNEFAQVDGEFVADIKALKEYGSEENIDDFLEGMERAKRMLLKKKDKLLNKCISKGYIRKNEKIKYSDDYLIEFINLLANLDEVKGEDKKDNAEKFAEDVGLAKKDKISFVTSDDRILRRKKELDGKFEKFGINVVAPNEILKIVKKEKPELYRKIVNMGLDEGNYIG